jgi:hypothetical protein
MTLGELQSPARRNDRHLQLIAASWRKPSEMARTANFAPGIYRHDFSCASDPSLNYESRRKAIPFGV